MDKKVYDLQEEAVKRLKEWSDLEREKRDEKILKLLTRGKDESKACV